MKKLTSSTILIIPIILIGMISACQLTIKVPANSPSTEQESDIPFETIVLDEEGFVNALGEQPQLVMINSADEIPQIAKSISREARQKLERVDFQHYIVIGLFRNAKPSGGYPTYIKRISKHGNQLIVQTEFWEPPPVYTGIIEATATYHLVKLARNGDLPATVELVLEAQIITSTPLPR
ncbi:MAG: hypothetical protein NT075_31365 [Chloroflexi bacterium]|nr:hypothetical protein [Chloroflexota bacterium]